MLRPPTVRLLALLVAAALVVTACGGGADDSTDGTDTDGTTTTAGGTGTGDDGDGGPGDAAGGAATGGSEGLGDAEPVPVQLTDLEPNEHGAPFPGRYLYDVTGADDPVELRVQDTLGDQRADRFDRTGNLIQLHLELEGAEARARLVHWRAEGMLLDAEQRGRNTTTGLRESATCDFEPNLLMQPKALRAGSRWTDESSCSAEQDGVTVTRKRTVTGEVVGGSTARVDGRTVDTVRIRQVIDTTTTSDSSPPLALLERRELTTDWIVAAGLAARVEGTILDTVSGAAKPARTFTWTLRSTTPTA